MSDPRQTRKVIELPFGGSEGLDATQSPTVKSTDEKVLPGADEFLWRSEPSAVKVAVPPPESAKVVEVLPERKSHTVERREDPAPDLDREYVNGSRQKRPLAAYMVMGLGALLIGSAVFGVALLPGGQSDPETPPVAAVEREPDPIQALVVSEVLTQSAVDVLPEIGQVSDRFFVDTRRPRLYRVHPIDHAQEKMPNVAPPPAAPVSKAPSVLAVVRPRFEAPIAGTAPKLAAFSDVRGIAGRPSGISSPAPLLDAVVPSYEPNSNSLQFAVAVLASSLTEDEVPSGPETAGSTSTQAQLPTLIAAAAPNDLNALASVSDLPPPPPIKIPDRAPTIDDNAPLLARVSVGVYRAFSEPAVDLPVKVSFYVLLDRPGATDTIPFVAPPPEPLASAQTDASPAEVPSDTASNAASADGSGSIMFFSQDSSETATAPRESAVQIFQSPWVVFAKWGEDTAGSRNRTVGLFDGTQIEAQEAANGWRYTVTESTSTAFVKGDRLLLEYNTSTKLSDAMALEKALAALSDAANVMAEFGVIRDGVLETVTLTLQP